MDPLSVSASAVALITVCVQTVQIIKQTIETVKTAKAELLNVLNETNRMRLLLEQLRGLTHQLGSRNNKILLAFDSTGCETVLSELKRLVDKIAQADVFVGFQFLIRKSKFDALVAGVRMQEDGIRTVLLESAVFTREYLQTLIKETNVQAVSISSITQSSVNVADDPPPPFSKHDKSPELTKQPLAKTELLPEVRALPHTLSESDDITPSTKRDLSSMSEIAHSTDSAAGLALRPSPLDKSDTTPRLRAATPALPDSQEHIGAAPNPPTFTRILSDAAVWHGQLSRDLYDDEYLVLRDKLADAAYFGDWRKVKATIDDAQAKGLGSWPNCYRISPSRVSSGWTPLHQAAFLCAPESVVRMLVNQGASRTLQTAYCPPSQLPYRNMTALEMARFLGFKHLFDALSPVIRHHIPARTMQKLQQNFHTLIKDDLASRSEYAYLRLPELDLLTELENPQMFFPLNSSKSAMGYLYQLDGRELLVTSLGISSSEQLVYHRITEQGVRKIEDAVLFDVF